MNNGCSHLLQDDFVKEMLEAKEKVRGTGTRGNRGSSPEAQRDRSPEGPEREWDDEFPNGWQGKKVNVHFLEVFVAAHGSCFEGLATVCGLFPSISRDPVPATPCPRSLARPLPCEWSSFKTWWTNRATLRSADMAYHGFDIPRRLTLDDATPNKNLLCEWSKIFG